MNDNNRLVVEVLRTRMVMSVRLATGQIIEVSGNAPKGSVVALHCSDVTPAGKVLGYEGFEYVIKPGEFKTLAQAADAAAADAVAVAADDIALELVPR